MPDKPIEIPVAIEDWDDAYANGAYIPGADDYITAWETRARDWRHTIIADQRASLDIAYGDDPREQYDLFHPVGTPLGIVVFVHGGYWVRFNRRYWSHLAEGAVQRGYQVMMPSYRLCPDTTIADICRQVSTAVTHAHAASHNTLPIKLTGHSAGGQIVTRLVCDDTTLPETVQQAIDTVMSISGVHDLRPLLKTALNQSLQLDNASAFQASPALGTPRTQAKVICVAGSDERPEFIRQTQLLANIWTGFGVQTASTLITGKHHFDIIDALAQPDSPMLHALLA